MVTLGRNVPTEKYIGCSKRSTDQHQKRKNESEGQPVFGVERGGKCNLDSFVKGGSAPGTLLYTILIENMPLFYTFN